MDPRGGLSTARSEGVPTSDPSQPILNIETAGPGEPCSSEAYPGAGGRDQGMDDYLRLQRRLILLTAAAIAVAVPCTAWGFGPQAAVSLLLGGMASLLYLRLLSRSVARLGVESGSLGKTQLLIPVLLVLVISRVPQLEVLPALAGFLLYKPALLLQALCEA